MSMVVFSTGSSISIRIYMFHSLCIYPNHRKENIRIKELVRSIDLFPTVLDIAGLPKPQPGTREEVFFP